MVTECLKQQGVKIALRGNGFTVTPKSVVTPKLLDYVRAHKADIIAELGGMADSPNTLKPTKSGVHTVHSDLHYICGACGKSVTLTVKSCVAYEYTCPACRHSGVLPQNEYHMRQG
ncbi:MAG: hypothetical protein ABFD83_13530 [Armatimonadota bacterium]